MTDVWITVGALTVLTFLIRASGPVLLGGREVSGPIGSLIPLLAPALLAALVVSETVGDADGLAVDERLAGVAAAAGVLAARRDAMLPAIAVAAIVTAALRAIA